ncbi:zona pellucida sperm-binding protein 4-like [Scomber scombrus]|uniref:Zona pellucida sperm-binding protein 4 n=1 Tax=Scomber scombrus TaxID=13677 RepID=A0AAV1PBK7_SCOSC|nr:zona pellucida sperm-binding protein 4-like [Scomber scombrus]
MEMKLICGCLLALALFCCLADAQYPSLQLPQKPKPTQDNRHHQKTQEPQIKNPSKTSDPSAFHTCEVEEQYKIRCGAPSISGSDCEAINCCFDGRTCFYGKSVTLQCTKDAQIILVVARDATLPNLDLESITFLGDTGTCNPVGTTPAFAIYQFPVYGCGTVMTEEPGVIIYENRMSSFYEVAVGPHGAITRDSHYELYIQCKYIGTTVEALVIEVGDVPAPFPVAAPGPLRVELRLANGQCTTKGCNEEEVAYNSFYVESDYPVVKVLRTRVYVEVRMLERTDPNIVLTLGRCWATIDRNPFSDPQWDLLIDGCPYRDDRYTTTLVHVDGSSGLMYPTHHRRFIFNMFTFVSTGLSNPGKGGSKNPGKGGADPEVMTPLKEKIHIHCDAAVCKASAVDNCEPRCFRNRRDIAASAKKDTRAETTVVSSHEVVIVDPSLSTQ